jgi:tetratricopeptide (TPR) repeat protein
VDWGVARGADAYPIAADAARRSLEIDPNLAEAHEATALVKILQDHDWAGSEEAFRRAIHLDPNDAMLRYEYGHLVLSTSGRQGAAIEQFQRSLAIDSGPVTYRNGLASAFLKDHRCSDAEAQSTLAHKLARSSISPLVYLGMAAECQGRHEEALGRYQEAAAKLRSGWVLGHFAQTLIRLERRDEARKLLAEMQAPRSGPVPLVDIATVYTALGEKARALDALEQAYTDMAPQMLWLKVEDRFDGLRNEPRFTMLMNKMGFVTSR